MIHTIQNRYWQAGILPEQGASLAFSRVRYSGAWVDITRPTPEGGKPGSFLMLPWANRIRGGRFEFRGETYQLETEPDDGTARHGDVRKRPWTLMEQSETSATYRISSSDFDDFNFPFALSTTLTYALDEVDFVWRVTLKNEDERPFPAGLGFHPYFMRHGPTMPRLTIPASGMFELTDAMADSAPVPVTDTLDFRESRAVPDDLTLDHLLTDRDPAQPIRLTYEQWRLEVQMHTDDPFRHVQVFTAPDGTLAIEPQTVANDGFNLFAAGVPGSGVLVVGAGESLSLEVRLRVVAL